ncbi:4a-hydroxytetrahydrobiopterin dehydratase [Streptomyces griseoviridis]|jgi:4a-hydroxytetrahydrobiopterin dehydratase|uniref:Putative pterin-4-alpha-carbinolamine dehydratase n=3 Tax=Streptomyces TaxID=1883 RepID=A0A918LF70_STRGD|nr:MULTISPECIES: 4a-hydroxytetrahydrobiopterin dehydratase [Streptomyces]MDP9685243.1 4a-hydroxytetrahydrobiopterin dehydratase [Streptomyces griseoviridis]GGS41597.1 putative pterin-4-alpha-carbinolamine dehydratase [Streptomyces niveoruber]GGS95815.1 putative pterin-4-alpha-carbinolamine dehydratase [Streptomyces griseoviridis]GGU31835.1 putative pterin-4-alpha-carbinolamine dehydratase [Streptomyces daghestanicus]GHI32843.1 putative pterin-4-alpha-carbinolamine dehydratase [Streptomyces dag
MPVVPLSPEEIEDRLAGLPGWSLDGDRLTRSYRLASHTAATAMVVHIAQVQEELDHHSDLTLGYDTVSLSVHTHSAGGAVTEKDVGLARRVEALAPAHGAR